MFGARFHLDFSRAPTGLVYLQGERFLEERHVLSELAQRGDVVVDVGANVGYTLLLFEQAVGLEGRVVCIEPEPANLDELRRNAAPFGNVEIHAVALSDAPGTLTLAPGHNARVTDGQGVQVPVTTLDTLLGSSTANLVKIDVEGYELNVLRGARKLLEREHPKLFIEMHPDLLPAGQTIAQIVRFVESLYEDVRFYVHDPSPLLRYVPHRALRQVSRESIGNSRFWMSCGRHAGAGQKAQSRGTVA